MRAAARQAPHRQSLDPEGRTDHPDVTGTIGRGASRLSCGAAVTRSVVADQPQLAAFRISQRPGAVQTASARRANVYHHRPAATIPGILDSQRPAAWCRYEPLHRRTPGSTHMVQAYTGNLVSTTIKTLHDL